jgi:rhodanese-related sulfurtransferase
MRKTLVVLVLLPVLLFACQAGSQEAAGSGVGKSADGYYTVNVTQLGDMLAAKDFVFVNVHIPFEGDIAGTDLSIPYDQITRDEYLSQLPAERDAKIVLYCRSGRMSAIAAKEMVALGYTNIWDVEGGMVAWEAAGFELER